VAYSLPLSAVMDSLKARLAAFQRSRVGLFVKKVLDDQAPNLAALLAWGTLSAILPLLLGILSLAGLVLRDQNTLDKVYNALYGVLPSDATGPISGVLDSMRQGSAAPAGIFAILLLLITGSSFFSNMASVFDQAYHVQGRNAVLERVVGLCMLIISAVLLIASTLAAGVSSLVTSLPGVLPIGPLLGQVIGWSISIISVFVLFALIYRVLPNAKQTWHDVVPGTLLSSVLLLLVTQLFPLYVKVFPPNHAYAVFGVFLLFTFWLYLVGLVFVLGAELNAFMQEPARSVALAEAAAAAEHGRADFEQATGTVTAEASGQAPAMRGGGPLGAPTRSANQQLGEHGQTGATNGQTGRTGAQAARAEAGHGGVAGHVLGLIGLVVAALLLRGRTVSEGDHRVAA
jgi:membrane protein